MDNLGQALTPEEKRMLKLYRQLDERDREDIVQTMKMWHKLTTAV